MNDKQHLSSLSHRKFGNCEIEWLIEEPFQLFKQKCVVLYTPEFIVRGFEETRFTMKLESQRGIKNHIFTFFLERSLLDEGPEEIWINMILSLSTSNYFHSEEKLFYLKNGSENRTPLLGLGTPLNQSTLFKSSLRIVCKLLVYSKGLIGKFKECSNAGLKLLSDNMLSLYTSGKNSDVKLIVQDNVILAHKSVLCARNEMLGNIINDDSECFTESSDDEEQPRASSDDEEEVKHYTTVEISSLDYNAMKKVLAYLYSGDLKHVLGEPSHAIYECAEYLDITEVEAFYRPDELTFRSSVDIEKFTYVIFFPIFNKLQGYPRVQFCTNENAKQVHFDSLPVNCEVYETLKNTSIRITVVDKNETLFACNVSLCNNEEKPVKMCEIIKPKSTESHPIDHIMKLTLALKVSSSTRNSYIIKESTNIKTYYDDDFTYKYLSSDLEELFEDGGLHSDISVNNNLSNFELHKCIIASRSSFFSDLLNASEREEDIIIPNIETDILYIVLNYLYSGILIEHMDDDDLVEVYNAAVKTKLPFLKSVCTGRLKKSLETNTTLRCRVMKIAVENNDKKLKKYVLDQLLKTVIRVPVSNEISFSDVQPCRHC